VKLQIATRLALYAVLQLAAEPEKQFAAAEIAARFGISVNHLAKVLRTLGRAGIVEAVRGAGGGYRLRANVKRTTLLDVIRLFEDVEPTARAEDGTGEGSVEGRALRRVLVEIDDIARATLSSITLATMLKLMEEQRGAADESKPGDRKLRASGVRGRD
jgi:Rrf2 family transcriptional regulator, nitric oxide-sensitive transcriptional repressor